MPHASSNGALSMFHKDGERMRTNRCVSSSKVSLRSRLLYPPACGHFLQRASPPPPPEQDMQTRTGFWGGGGECRREGGMSDGASQPIRARMLRAASPASLTLLAALGREDAPVLMTAEETEQHLCGLA